MEVNYFIDLDEMYATEAHAIVLLQHETEIALREMLTSLGAPQDAIDRSTVRVLFWAGQREAMKI